MSARIKKTLTITAIVAGTALLIYAYAAGILHM
jgi:hypothetical protein